MDRRAGGPGARGPARHPAFAAAVGLRAALAIVVLRLGRGPLRGHRAPAARGRGAHGAAVVATVRRGPVRDAGDRLREPVGHPQRHHGRARRGGPHDRADRRGAAAARRGPGGGAGRVAGGTGAPDRQLGQKGTLPHGTWRRRRVTAGKRPLLKGKCPPGQRVRPLPICSARNS